MEFSNLYRTFFNFLKNYAPVSIVMDGVDNVESIGPSSVKVGRSCGSNIRVLNEDKVQGSGGLGSNASLGALECDSVVPTVILSVPIREPNPLNPLTMSS